MDKEKRNLITNLTDFSVGAMPCRYLGIPFGRILRASASGGNYAPVTWKTMCLSKEQEGLGLRDTRSWNDTLLTKTLWNVHAKNDTLWCRWIHHVKKTIEAECSIPNAIGLLPSCILEVDKTCKLGKKIEETHSQLFFCCPFAKEVLRNIREWLGLRRSMSTFLMSLKWLLRESMGSTRKFKWRKLCFAATLYYLWQYRNKSNFLKRILTHLNINLTIYFAVWVVSLNVDYVDVNMNLYFLVSNNFLCALQKLKRTYVVHNASCWSPKLNPWPRKFCDDGTPGTPFHRGNNYECMNMKFPLKQQQQRVLLGSYDLSCWGAIPKNSFAKHEYLKQCTSELMPHREVDNLVKI
ncbi:hypothetical protein M9H77_04927 [Catharanthus roseus]|uniref:Uncharacterized protein n=1 Tax=Catharanthus roseus TaxID=4058 RepID=A0ACC0CFX8_CATRO|nr:hypothetical protein M9H77_04927 [Catharanthus roseus]